MGDSIIRPYAQLTKSQNNSQIHDWLNIDRLCEKKRDPKPTSWIQLKNDPSVDPGKNLMKKSILNIKEYNEQIVCS